MEFRVLVSFVKEGFVGMGILCGNISLLDVRSFIFVILEFGQSERESQWCVIVLVEC